MLANRYTLIMRRTMSFPPPRPQRLQRGRGFTLIELLVVVAIISILAGILFPVFARAREKAYETDCLAKAKQLGMALQMYATDYDGRLPIQPATQPAMAGYQAGVPNWRLSAWPTWTRAIEPIVSNAGLFRCKSAEPLPGTQEGMGSSYFFNGVALGRSMDAPPDTSSYALLHDVKWYSDMAVVNPTLHLADPPAAQELTGLAPHNGRFIILYFDLHVASMDELQINTRLLKFAGPPFWF